MLGDANCVAIRLVSEANGTDPPNPLRCVGVVHGGRRHGGAGIGRCRGWAGRGWWELVWGRELRSNSVSERSERRLGSQHCVFLLGGRFPQTPSRCGGFVHGGRRHGGAEIRRCRGWAGRGWWELVWGANCVAIRLVSEANGTYPPKPPAVRRVRAWRSAKWRGQDWALPPRLVTVWWVLEQRARIAKQFG